MIFWKKWRAKSAIEQQIQTHLPMLERIVASFESRPALQQELLQEVVVAIWQAAEQFTGDASMKTYMARIAQNRCVSHVDLAVKQPKPTELDKDIHSEENLDTALDSEKNWQRLMQQIQGLPIQQKQVLSLMLEGFSYRDIADICGLTESHVGVLINRGKATLNNQLSQGAA